MLVIRIDDDAVRQFRDGAEAAHDLEALKAVVVEFFDSIGSLLSVVEESYD